MTIYNYLKVRDIQNDLEPYDIWSIIETSSAIYYLNITQKIIYKTADEGLTVSSVVSSDDEIWGIWYDRTNSRIYFIQDTGTINSIRVKYIDLSDDTIITLNSNAYSCNRSLDVFKIGTDVYIYTSDNINGYIEIAKWDGANDFVSEDILANHDIAGTYYQTTFIVVIGTNAYWAASAGDDADGGKVRIRIYKFNSLTSTISEESEYNSTSYGFRQKALTKIGTPITYDGSDVLSFSTLDTITGLITNYTTYSILNDSFNTVDAIYIDWMVDRNTNTSNNPPFNLEKGFGINTGTNDLMVYQISRTKGHFYKIADLTNAGINSGVIVGVTDTYLFIKETDGNIELWKFQSMDLYVTQELVDYALLTFNHGDRSNEIRGIPVAQVTYNSSVLCYEEGMFVQIIGTTRINGVTTSNDVGFEGYIYKIEDRDKNTDYLKSMWKVAKLINPAYNDLLSKSPIGNFTDDTDAYITAFLAYWDYITAGTLDDGALLGTHYLSSADKNYAQYIIEFGALDNFIARLRPTGELDYNNGTDDSGIDYSSVSTPPISRYWRGDRAQKYNQITVTGAYVNGALITGTTQNDLALQISDGIQPLEISISWLNTAALCTTMGASILTLLKNSLIFQTIELRDATNGMILPGETITVTYAPRSFAATQMLITRVQFDFRTYIAKYWLSDAVRMEKEDFSYSIPAVNSEHIDQLSIHITEGGGLITKTGWDPDVVLALSFTDGTRTFTITPTGTAYYYISNAEYSISAADTVVIDDTEGIWFIYYVGTTLTASQTPWTIEDADVCMISVIYWDATNNVHSWLAYNCHRWVMDADTHSYLHNTFGTQISLGGTLSDMSVDGGGTLDAHCQFQNDATTIHDEDIKISQTARTKTSNLSVYYRTGADASDIWRVVENTSFPVVHTGGAGEDRAAWNQLNAGTWSLVEVTDNRFVLGHIFVSTDKTRKFGVIVGQAEYSSLLNSREGALTELNSIISAGLPSREFRFLATIIIQTKDTYSNTPYAQIVSVNSDGDEYIDWTGDVEARSGIALTHFDPNAFHSNIAGEFAALTAKGTPTTSDIIAIEDAAASNAKKYTTLGALPVVTDLATHEALKGSNAHGSPVTGSYTGDGSDDWSKTILPTGFTGLTPKLVQTFNTHAGDGENTIMFQAIDQTTSYAYRIQGGAIQSETTALKVVSGGFAVRDSGANNHPNTDGATYYYIAWF